MNEKELEVMKKNYETRNLIDIENVKVNGFLATEELLQECILQIKNPYHFMSGDVEISIFYDDSTIHTIRNALRDYFLREK